MPAQPPLGASVPSAAPESASVVEGPRHAARRSGVGAAPGRVGPGRALVGATVAVAGVALVIGALLLMNPGQDRKVPVALAPTHTASAGLTRPANPPAAGTPATGTTATPRLPQRPVRPKARSPEATLFAAPTLPVTVLNNSQLTGLARRAAARYREGGWLVAVTGNFTGRLRATTVYFAAGQQGSAARFAKQFGVARVLPRFPGLPGHGLTVVLTRDTV